jgi:hypothetical protein
MRFAVPCGRSEVGVFLNVQTPYLPITTDGKEPNLSLLGDGIADAVGKAVKQGKRLARLFDLGAKSKSQKEVITDTLPEVIRKASGEGRYRFSIRQLFYAVRPYFLEAFGKEPAYDYFAEVITATGAAGVGGVDAPAPSIPESEGGVQ